MRRPHRRAHLLIWLALAPIVLGGVWLALYSAPAEPLADLPADIISEAP